MGNNNIVNPPLGIALWNLFNMGVKQTGFASAVPNFVDVVLGAALLPLCTSTDPFLGTLASVAPLTIIPELWQ